LRGLHRAGDDRRAAPPAAADRRRRAARAAGVSSTTWAWISLALPLLGTLVAALGYRALPGRSAGWLATAAVLGSFAAAIAALIALEQRAPGQRQLVSSLWTYAATAGIDARMSILVDPLSVF